MNRRITGDRTTIDTDMLRDFFRSRARRHSESSPAVSMLYQDSNPELAAARDRVEKDMLVPLLRLHAQDRIIDVGCGVGRWAYVFASRVRRYLGTDPIDELLQIARAAFAAHPDVAFQNIAAQDITAKRLVVSGPFDVAIAMGVLHYLNDDDCLKALGAVASVMADRGRVLIRVPIGVEQRLTLDSIWSDELHASYSAIYRTDAEYRAYINDVFGRVGFRVERGEPLYPAALNNRVETLQYYYLLER